MTLEPLHIPALLRKFGISPQKSLGQNFLVDHNALKKIVQEAGVAPGDDVLEIGAGVGNLTRMLAVQARSVTAVELDRKLLPVLAEVTHPFENVRIINEDILAVDTGDLFSDPDYLVVANIPYYITSAVIRHLLESAAKPARIALTIQREVAERIVSRDEKMSLLSLSVQIYGSPRIAAHIPADCFYPPPKIDSSLLLIDVDRQPELAPEEISRLFRLAHAAFNQKRKMLRNSLKPVLGQDAARVLAAIDAGGIDPRRRPESLALEEWVDIVNIVGKV